MIPWKFCWNNVRLRPTRTLLTIFSIAGGVAAVVAVLQSAAMTRSQLDLLHETLDSRVAMEITAADASPFSHEDLPLKETITGVSAVIPTFRLYAKITAGTEEVRGIALGVDLEKYHAARDFRLTEGRSYEAPGEVCLEAAVAERLDVHVGDEIRMGTRSVPRMFPKKVVGIVQPQGIGAAEETAGIFMPIADAARLGRAQGKATSLQIVLEPKAVPDDVAARFRTGLPENLVVAMTASAADLSESTQAMINFSLSATAVLSVVAAIFIVINTFQISITERQRQLALVRIVGATATQIRWSIYLEALAFAALGTVLGILLGIVGSRFLSSGMVDLFGLKESPSGRIQLHAVLAGVVFGPLVTLIAVWYPTRKACEAAPLRVLKSALAPRREFPRRKFFVFGIVMLIAALLMFGCTYFEIAEDWTSILAIGFLQIGGLLCLPTLIRPITSILYRPLRSIFPVESLLGNQQLLDNFTRTALTMAVLFVVSSTSMSIGNTTLSVTKDVDTWLDRSVTADFLLRASRPRIDMSESEELSPDLEPGLKSIPGISSIDRMSFSKVSINGTSATLMLRQLSDFDPLPLDMLEGNSSDLRARVIAGEAVLGSVLANNLGCRPGDTVHVDLSGIVQTIKVAGIARQYNSGGLMVMMDRQAALELFPVNQIQGYGIRGVPGDVAQLGDALRAFAKKEGLVFQSMSDLRKQIHGMLAGITSRLWMILALALVIAGFGIVNTLTMNVIQQTRHLGVLRVVGLTRSQVVRMFLLQAFAMGATAMIPGTILGLFMAFLITISFSSVANHGVQFSVHWQLLVGYLTGGILLSVLAATLPAIRAGRLKPLEAIHEE
jgi:putative ABC transport system permease protein